MYPGEFYFSIGRHAWERVVRKIGISLAFSSETEDTPDPEVTANKDRPRSRSRDRQRDRQADGRTDGRTVHCLFGVFFGLGTRSGAPSYLCRSSRSSFSLPPPAAPRHAIHAFKMDRWARKVAEDKKAARGNSAAYQVVRHLCLCARYW